MMQLLQGWLAVQWGHSLLFLLAFGAARVLPKVALTVPAGVLCDRVSRRKVLLVCRFLNCGAALLPLAGFFMPAPMAWLMAGIVLGGGIHAFDLPSGRAVLGDVTVADNLYPVILLNNAGSHLAALVGPLLAFVLGPWGLALSAGLMFIASVMILAMSVPAQSIAPVDSGVNGLVRYAAAAPAISGLVLLGLAPSVLDKGVLLLIPSIASGAGTISLALLAPELGGLLAALLVSLKKLRYRSSTIAASALCYVGLLAFAFQFSYEPELLILGLTFAGAAKLAFNATSQVRIQETVPAELRGRVFAF